MIRGTLPISLPPRGLSRSAAAAYLGIALEPPAPNGTSPFAISLGHIDPEEGYVRGNVRLVCLIVNYAMNSLGEAPLRRLIKHCR